MIEGLIFLAGAVVGVFMGYRWGKQDVPQDAQTFASPLGGGGPNPEK